MPDLEQTLDRRPIHDLTSREPGATNLATDQATRPRSPSPVRIRERVVERERSPSPAPLERVRTRVIERERSLSPAPLERVRTRVIERERSPSPAPLERAKTRVDERILQDELPEQSRLSQQKDLHPASQVPDEDLDFALEFYSTTKKSKKDKKKRRSGLSMPTEGTEPYIKSSQTEPPGFDPPEPYGPDSRVDVGHRHTSSIQWI